MVFRLIRAGADLGSGDWLNDTPLHAAVAFGHEELAFELLKLAGEEHRTMSILTARSVDGQTPYDVAVRWGCAPPRTTALLLAGLRPQGRSGPPEASPMRLDTRAGRILRHSPRGVPWGEPQDSRSRGKLRRCAGRRFRPARAQGDSASAIPQHGTRRRAVRVDRDALRHLAAPPRSAASAAGRYHEMAKQLKQLENLTRVRDLTEQVIKGGGAWKTPPELKGTLLGKQLEQELRDRSKAAKAMRKAAEAEKREAKRQAKLEEKQRRQMEKDEAEARKRREREELEAKKAREAEVQFKKSLAAAMDAATGNVKRSEKQSQACAVS